MATISGMPTPEPGDLLDNSNLARERRIPDRETEPGPFKTVSRPLWILLGLSLLFVLAVQIYVRNIERPSGAIEPQVADAPVMSTESPPLPVLPASLQLQWNEISGTVFYNLRIHSVSGSPVVDPLMVWGTNWRPSEEVLPGLQSGDYRWTIEALDSSGSVLARSMVSNFEISR